MRKNLISEDLLLKAFDLIKVDNNCSTSTIASLLGISRMTVHRAVVELKHRKWIKPKAERINNVVVYQITKKD